MDFTYEPIPVAITRTIKVRYRRIGRLLPIPFAICLLLAVCCNSEAGDKRRGRAAWLWASSCSSCSTGQCAAQPAAKPEPAKAEAQVVKESLTTGSCSTGTCGTTAERRGLFSRRR